MFFDLLMIVIYNRDLLFFKKIYDIEFKEDRLFLLDFINRGERMIFLCLVVKLGNFEIVEYLL